jgi:hypothetical protein
MSSISLAHGFSRHTKIASLSDLAFRIWVAGIERADEQLTDGLLKKADLDLLPKMPTTKRARDAVVAELVAAKLWIVVEEGASWQIHDFLEWQDSSAVARRKREEARERMRRLRLNGSQIVRENKNEMFEERSREQNDEAEEMFARTNGERSRNVLAAARAPALSLISSGSLSSPDLPALSASSEGPDPLGARGGKPRKTAPAKWRVVPSDWQPTDEHREIAAARGVDFDLELAKFRDHEFAQPKSNASAAFRNWLRGARSTLRPGMVRGAVAPRQPDSGYQAADYAEEVT